MKWTGSMYNEKSTTVLIVSSKGEQYSLCCSLLSQEHEMNTQSREGDSFNGRILFFAFRVDFKITRIAAEVPFCIWVGNGKVRAFVGKRMQRVWINWITDNECFCMWGEALVAQIVFIIIYIWVLWKYSRLLLSLISSKNWFFPERVPV